MNKPPFLAIILIGLAGCAGVDTSVRHDQDGTSVDVGENDVRKTLTVKSPDGTVRTSEVRHAGSLTISQDGGIRKHPPAEESLEKNIPHSTSSEPLSVEHLYDFRPKDLNPSALADELADGDPWDIRITSVLTATGPITSAQAVQAFNTVLHSTDLWKTADTPNPLPSGPQTVLSKIRGGEPVTEDERLTLHRALLQAAFPKTTSASPRVSVGNIPFAPKSTPGRLKITTARDYIHVWSDVQSAFEAPGLPGLSWSEDLGLSGRGPSISIGMYSREYESKDSVSVNLETSLFEGSRVRRQKNQGPYFARERVRLKGGSIGVMAEETFGRVLTAGLGGQIIVAHYETALETNAPAYSHLGAKATHVLPAINMSAGLVSPWPSFAKPFVKLRYSLICDDVNPFNIAVGEFLVGAAFEF